MTSYVAASFLAMWLPADKPPPVAMVLQVKGTVTVERGADPDRRAGIMLMLYPDDRLKVESDSEAGIVFFSDEYRERLKPNTQVTVGKLGCTPASAVERFKSPNADKPAVRPARVPAHRPRRRERIPRWRPAKVRRVLAQITVALSRCWKRPLPFTS